MPTDADTLKLLVVQYTFPVGTIVYLTKECKTYSKPASSTRRSAWGLSPVERLKVETSLRIGLLS